MKIKEIKVFKSKGLVFAQFWSKFKNSTSGWSNIWTKEKIKNWYRHFWIKIEQKLGLYFSKLVYCCKILRPVSRCQSQGQSSVPIEAEACSLSFQCSSRLPLRTLYEIQQKLFRVTIKSTWDSYHGSVFQSRGGKRRSFLYIAMPLKKDNYQDMRDSPEQQQ